MVRLADKVDLYVHLAERDQGGSVTDWNVIGPPDMGGSVVERCVLSPYGELGIVNLPDTLFFPAFYRPE